MKNEKLTASSHYFLDEITSPKLVVEGELNLFLIELKNGELQAHSFVMTLQSGDVFPPIPKITYLAKDYAFALISVGTSTVKETDSFDLKTWQAKWNSENPEELYLEFIKEYQTTTDKKQILRKDNRAITALSLTNKVAALGKVASLKLAGDHKVSAETDSLLINLQKIAKIYHLNFDKSKSAPDTLSTAERIELFCQNSNWRMRKVTLTEDVYQQNARPILGIRKSTGEALVIYPSANGATYGDIYDGHKKKPLTPNLAADLELTAYCFYELFPTGQLNKQKLLNFIFGNSGNIFAVIIITGLISTVLSLVSPLATAYITGKIIPTANLPELGQISILLTVLLICQILLGVVPSLLLMLFSSHQFERFQAAVYDHILRISPKALKICDTGDMTQRVLGATQIQATIFNVISQQFLSSFFAIFSLAVMFYYSKSLAFAGLIMVLIYSVTFFLFSQFNLKPLAAHAAASGRVSGLLKQFLDGVSKIRNAGAEQQVINRFMDDFSTMSKEQYKISTLGIYQDVFTTAFPTVISLIFYALAGGFMETNLELPLFLAFMAAFQNFQGGVMGLASGLWTLLAIKPEVDRIMPILEAEIEDGEAKYLPGKLDGNISLSHVNFRYDPDGPLILENVSIEAKSGEFIAVVGASGAGKSTLVRLLLGLDKVESGAVYYSNQDLSNLNLQAVRRQLGVILQNSKVMNGSILANITIGTEYNKTDAFAALELSAYADDVANLPMGIHTLITPDSISGGQQQRILIARALIGNPVAVIMDESTSALDNMTQEIVKKNMESLKMTRIVIAHRLSTIINADRIYVLDKGRVVECGTYQELIDLGGVFNELASRQKL